MMWHALGPPPTTPLRCDTTGVNGQLNSDAVLRVVEQRRFAELTGPRIGRIILPERGGTVKIAVVQLPVPSRLPIAPI